MMETQIRRLALGAAALTMVLCMAGTALATNGYFSHGQGLANKAMGGAGVALPQDSFTSANNPAGLALVADRLDASAAVFMPDRSYSYSGPSPLIATAQQSSDSTQFIVPGVGYRQGLGEDQAFGVAVYGRGGMNTDYAQPVYAGGSGATGVNLAQLFVNVGYAMDLGSTVIGASALVVRQEFEAKGLQGFDNAGFSTKPGSVTNNGTDTSNGVGIALGVLVEIGDDLRAGASYQPAIAMSKFSKYAGLFAEQGGFDIPSSWAVGLAWGSGTAFQVAFDYQTINYSDVKSIANPGPTSGPPATRMGADDGPGFGWTDIAVYKLGMQYAPGGAWTWRAGINHGENPVQADQTLLNILAPGVMTDHLTFGFTMASNPQSEWSMAFMYALENSVEGSLPAGLGGGTTTLTMSQMELELGYGHKF